MATMLENILKFPHIYTFIQCVLDINDSSFNNITMRYVTIKFCEHSARCYKLHPVFEWYRNPSGLWGIPINSGVLTQSVKKKKSLVLKKKRGDHFIENNFSVFPSSTILVSPNKIRIFLKLYLLSTRPDQSCF